MNRDASSFVHSATMPITHVILSIQPFPYAILVITSSDYHSPSVISADGNPRKPYSEALQLDFSPLIQPHLAIPADGNPRKPYSVALQLDFSPTIQPHLAIPPDGNPRKPYSEALQLDFSPLIQPHPAIPPTEIHENTIPRHSTAFQLDFRGIMCDNAMRQQFRIK